MNLQNARKLLALAPAFALAVALSPAVRAADPAEVYQIDPVHSAVSFKIRHLVSHVEGQFKDFSGTITADPAHPESASVVFAIKAASIDTRVEQRDKHLRSGDFFDVDKFPDITFKSTKIVPAGADKYDVTGSFTMHGVTKEITIPVSFMGLIKDPWGNQRAGFSIALTLNRRDYGIVWNKVLDQGGTMLGDDVAVSIELEAVKKTPPSAGEPAKK